MKRRWNGAIIINIPGGKSSSGFFADNLKRVCPSVVCSIVKRVRRGINMRGVCACARVFDKRAISHHHRLLVMIYLPIGEGRPQFLRRIFDEFSKKQVAAILTIFLLYSCRLFLDHYSNKYRETYFSNELSNSYYFHGIAPFTRKIPLLMSSSPFPSFIQSAIMKCWNFLRNP